MRAAIIALIRRIRRMRASDAIVRFVRWLPRWLLGAAAAILFTGAVVLAVAGGVGSVGASIGRSLLTALIVALLAWLWFGFYTSEESTGELRRRAQLAPESLFATPPRVGAASNVVGRDELVAELLANLRPEMRTGPQLVVGETGSGKTSLLLRIAAALAQDSDVLPIVVSLRRVEDLDFHTLARQQFEEYIDPHVRARDDVDRLWRWLCRRGKIVVLADDLDRARLPSADDDPHGTAARAALEAAHRRGLALVVTSRPQGVPRNLAEPPIDLGPLELSPDAAAEHVVARSGREGDASAVDLVRATIERGQLFDNAFYLGLIRELLRTRRLARPPEGGPHAVRVTLLNRWYAGLLGEHVGQGERERRVRILEAVSDFAAATLAPADDPRAAAMSSRAAADALQAVEQSGVVYLDDDGRYRFAHEVVHAYLASRAIVRDPGEALEAVSRAPDAPRVQLALVLCAANTRADGLCHDVGQALLVESSRYEDERRLLRAAAAAEVAVAGGYSGLDGRIAEECAVARAGASPVARRAALEHLARLSGERAIEATWEYASDLDYEVRWVAAQKLVERCSDEGGASARAGYLAGPEAYRVMANLIEDALGPAQDSLAAGRHPDDWEPEIVPLKHIAWMLPALRTAIAPSADEDASATVEAQLKELLRLEREGVTPQRGLEASIAQGFKVDARLRRDAPIDDEVVSRLGRSETFWYSQLNLLHALTLRAVHGGPEIAGSTLRRFADDRGQHHPFVRATAKLCQRALAEVSTEAAERADARVDRYVWDDEGVVVSRLPRGLAEDVVQLVGDIVVLLGMNEAGTAAERVMFGEANELPHCMKRSRDRTELFTKCVDGAACEFMLCPIGPPMDRLSARREISRAFCRHQRLHAHARTARLWDSQVHKRGLREFWRRLESAARF